VCSDVVTWCKHNFHYRTSTRHSSSSPARRLLCQFHEMLQQIIAFDCLGPVYTPAILRRSCCDALIIWARRTSPDHRHTFAFIASVWQHPKLSLYRNDGVAKKSRQHRVCVNRVHTENTVSVFYELTEVTRDTIISDLATCTLCLTVCAKDCTRRLCIMLLV